MPLSLSLCWTVSCRVCSEELASRFLFHSVDMTPQPPFSVRCNNTVDSVANEVSVVCVSSGGDIDTLNCTFDNSSLAQDCRKSQAEGLEQLSLCNHSLFAVDVDGMFVIDLEDFSPGLHSLNVVGISEDGDVDSADIIFFTVPEPLGTS